MAKMKANGNGEIMAKCVSIENGGIGISESVAAWRGGGSAREAKGVINDGSISRK